MFDRITDRQTDGQNGLCNTVRCITCNHTEIDLNQVAPVHCTQASADFRWCSLWHHNAACLHTAGPRCPEGLPTTQATWTLRPLSHYYYYYYYFIRYDLRDDMSKRDAWARYIVKRITDWVKSHYFHTSCYKAQLMLILFNLAQLDSQLSLLILRCRLIAATALYQSNQSSEQSRCCFKRVHVCLSLSPAWQLWRAKQVMFQKCPRVSVIITCMTAVTSKAGVVSKVFTCVCHYHLHDSCDEQSRCCFKGVRVCLSL